MLRRISLTVIALLFACSLAGAGSAGTSSKAAVSQNGAFEGVIEMYVTDWCGYCRKARKYMDANGIRYVAYDIEKDSAAKHRYEELGGGGVPLIIIGSKKMSGFSPEALEHYMKQNQ